MRRTMTLFTKLSPKVANERKENILQSVGVGDVLIYLVLGLTLQ